MPLATGPSVWTRKEGSWEGEGTPAGEAPGLHQPEVVLPLLSSILNWEGVLTTGRKQYSVWQWNKQKANLL